MKGLRKYIAPFAPDQSGAAAVLCELGGMVIILDAGGCAGNICGFDEPRWFGSRSAIFSAGLRDMDAILGRDERLVEKITLACQRIKAKFIAVIGTPVPSVIGTDYRAIKRMIEKKTGLPVLALDTNGMDLYDVGVRKAMESLVKTFVKKENEEKIPGSLGVWGATPLDVTVPTGSWDIPETPGAQPEYGRWLVDYYQAQGYEIVHCYGMGAGVEEIEKAGTMEKNLVIAPAALAAARELERSAGVPFETGYPLETLPGWSEIENRMTDWSGKKVLIVHQQMLANALREQILTCGDADVTVASWFSLDREFRREGDLLLKEEDQWIQLVREGQYDVICADPLFFAAAPFFEGERWEIPHFAVSGKR